LVDHSLPASSQVITTFFPQTYQYNQKDILILYLKTKKAQNTKLIYLLIYFNRFYAKKTEPMPKNRTYAKKNQTYAKKTELTPKKPNLRQKNRTYSKKTELTPKKPNLRQKTELTPKNRRSLIFVKKGEK